MFAKSQPQELDFHSAWSQLKKLCPSLSRGDFEVYFNEPGYWVRRNRSPLADYDEFAGNPDPLEIGQNWVNDRFGFDGGRG